MRERRLPNYKLVRNESGADGPKSENVTYVAKIQTDHLSVLTFLNHHVRPSGSPVIIKLDIFSLISSV